MSKYSSALRSPTLVSVSPTPLAGRSIYFKPCERDRVAPKDFSNSLSLRLRIQLVTALFFPVFYYSAAFFTDLTGQQKLKLRRLMNSRVQFIYNLRKDEHILGYYERLRWLDSDDRREYLTCSLLFSIILKSTPPYLSENFLFTVPSHTCALYPPLPLTLPSPSAAPLPTNVPFIR